MTSLMFTEAVCLPSGLLNFTALASDCLHGLTANCLVLSLISTLTYAGYPSAIAVALLKRTTSLVTNMESLPRGAVILTSSKPCNTDMLYSYSKTVLNKFINKCTA